MFSKILVPLDGSKTAEKALPHARSFARKLKVPVELLAVVDIAEIASHTASERPRFLDSVIDRAVEQSSSYLKGVAQTFADVGGVKCSVEKGKAEEAIIEKAASDRTMLVAMATHGRSGLNRFLLGSVAEKTLRGTVNPLLMVRATEEPKTEGETLPEAIFVPLDGSELGEGVLPTVADLAKKLDLGIELFRAYHIPYNAYGGDAGFYAGNYEELISGVRDEAIEYLGNKAAELRKLGVPKVTSVVKDGIAGDEIITWAQKTRALIAMCSHGRSGVKRWVLGSVAETVVRHAANPVLITRPG